MSTAVVLGSNSFSGQDFIDHLLSETDLDVIGISRSEEKPPVFLRYRQNPEIGRYRFFSMDMNQDMDDILALLDREKPAYIVNFAAQSEVAPSWNSPEDWFLTNTVALSRLVNHLRGQDYLDKYLHISSPEAYGNCVGTVTEIAPDNPSTPYAASKSAADMLLETYRREFNFPLVTVRATNVYGPRQQLFKIIPRTVVFIKSGRMVELHGGGAAVKSWINVRDVSRGEHLVLQHGRIGERYHLSPEAGLAVRDVVKLVCEIMGETFEEVCKVVGERTGQDAVYVIDSTKARQELGWVPQIDLEQGLTEVVAWGNKYWDDIKNQELTYIHRP
jgi:dTDP-glucose 4,6-dehydratase